MIKLYIMQEKSDRKIIICDVSAYNTHPDYRPDFRRKNAYYTRKITVVYQTDRSVSFIRFASVKLTYHGGVYISGLTVFAIDIKDFVYFVYSVNESLRHNDIMT